MTRFALGVGILTLLTLQLGAQEKRLWVLRPSGEMVEYDPATFSAKQTIKVPDEALKSPQNLSVNHLGQVLFSPSVSLPLSDTEAVSPPKAWFWNGRSSIAIDLGVKRDVAVTGSNQAVTEIAPAVYLSSDGTHLFWFANQARRLVREDVDLSTTTTWQAWRSDLTGGMHEDLTSVKFPECRCPSGACEESCPYGEIWVPETGMGKLSLLAQLVAGKMGPVYKQGSRCQEDGGKWSCTPLPEPLHRVLEAASDGSVIIEAIPDTSCCGWTNQSDDQTLAISDGKSRTLFDEIATYRNSDYDVSFYTSNARLSPAVGFVAMTITSTAETNKPIQLAEGGEATPEESKEIRRALTELPAVEVMTMGDTLKRVALVPHATLVGWINEKEILTVENHLLVIYNISTKAKRRSTVKAEDAAHVFLR